MTHSRWGAQTLKDKAATPSSAEDRFAAWVIMAQLARIMRTLDNKTTKKVGFGGTRKRKRPRSKLFQRNVRRSAAVFQELKFHDIVVTDALIAQGYSTVDTVVIIPQGVQNVQRIGARVRIKKIQWRFQLRLDVSAGTGLETGDVCRIILYQDKQCNGATAAGADILNAASSGTSYLAFRNLDNVRRFTILMDRTYDMNVLAAAGDGTANATAEHHLSDTFFKDVDIVIDYDGAAGALTEMRSNNIGMLLQARDGGAVQFESRMRFRFEG